MGTLPEPRARLASEDVIINAPMSYAGSAQRIMRLRRGASGGGQLAALTSAAVILIVVAWVFITVWYLMWGLLLVPYRLLRRGARKRKAEALRHRELMGTIEGSAAASAAAFVNAALPSRLTAPAPAPLPPASQLIGDLERERASDALRMHLLAGRVTAEEFEERLGTIHRARRRADLSAALADLPEPPDGD